MNGFMFTVQPNVGKTKHTQVEYDTTNQVVQNSSIQDSRISNENPKV